MHDSMSCFATSPASRMARGVESRAARRRDASRSGAPPRASASASAASSRSSPQRSVAAFRRRVTSRTPFATRAGMGGGGSGSRAFFLTFERFPAIVSKTLLLALAVSTSSFLRARRKASPTDSSASSSFCFTSCSSASASVGSSGRSGFIFRDEPGPVAGPTGACRSCHTANRTAGATASIAALTAASAASTLTKSGLMPILSTLPNARAARSAGSKGSIAFGMDFSMIASARSNVYANGTLWSALVVAASARIARAFIVKRAAAGSRRRITSAKIPLGAVPCAATAAASRRSGGPSHTATHSRLKSCRSASSNATSRRARASSSTRSSSLRNPFLWPEEISCTNALCTSSSASPAFFSASATALVMVAIAAWPRYPGGLPSTCSSLLKFLRTALSVTFSHALKDTATIFKETASVSSDSRRRSQYSEDRPFEPSFSHASVHLRAASAAARASRFLFSSNRALSSGESRTAGRK